LNRSNTILVTGGTGYIGSRLIPALAAKGHAARALVRARSAARLSGRCEPVVGDALDHTTFVERVKGCDTFVQLVGTPHPSPAKAQDFLEVDLVSARESVAAAKAAGVSHFIYVSVAQPAPVMGAYIAVRARGEAMLKDAGLTATILRPWYVLGPGHRWPYLLVPVYWVMERFASTRASALRLGVVTLEQMVGALVDAVEHRPRTTRIVEVPGIRAGFPHWGRDESGAARSVGLPSPR